MSGGTTQRQEVIIMGAGATQELAQAVVSATRRVNDAWRAPDTEERAEILAEVCVDDVDFSNPMVRTIGVRAMAEAITRISIQYPDYLPDRISGIDIHHDTARYDWAMRDRAGQAVLQGVEVVRFTPAGRLIALTSFFGEPPSIRYTYYP
jgi:hypothetical protein